MPYAKRSYRKKRKYKKKKGRSFGQKLMRDARKPGKNSLVEKAVALIAKKEAKKLLPPNLIFRRYCFSDYDLDTNIWSQESLLDIDSELIYHPLQIPVWDVQTLPVSNPTSDPLQFPAVPNYDRGQNVLAAGLDQNGFRNSSQIVIQNMSVQLRFSLAPARSTQTAPRKECARIRYALILVKHPDAHTLQWKPTMDMVMPFKGFGFSNRLDRITADTEAETKVRVLASGKCNVYQKSEIPQEIYKKMYWQGNMKYRYQEYIEGVQGLDQNGQRVAGSQGKVFLVVTSDTPSATVDEYKVKCAACCKIGYKNVA